MNIDYQDLVKLDHACLACQTNNLTGKQILPGPEMRSKGIRTLNATKCDSCGDIRLYATCSSPEIRAEVRGELDFISAMLTEAICEELPDVQH